MGSIRSEECHDVLVANLIDATIMDECKKRNVVLKLCGLNENLTEVVKVMHFHKMFEIHGDRGKALTAFKKKGWFG